MSAKEMFEELGYKLEINDDKTIMYKRKDDYINYSVWFNLDTKTYTFTFMDWLDNKNNDWIPMMEREDNLKHCAAYGHWQKVDYPINKELHKAINKQVEELGWK